MGDMPNIEPGSTFEDFFAREWQNLVRTVEKLARIEVKTTSGDTIALVDTGSTFSLTLDRLISPPVAGNRRVAVWLPVDPDAATITVREVVYKVDGPPVEGQYAWGGEPFQVYPDIGSRVGDYSNFHFPFEQPTLDTQILTARHGARFWFLELPSAQERAVVLRAMAEPADGSDARGSRFVIVQEVVPSIPAGGVWTGGFDAVGDPATVNVWPTMVAGDFEPFIWTAAELNDRTTILPLVQYRGVWYLKQRPKRAVSRRQGPVKVLDCAPAT